LKQRIFRFEAENICGVPPRGSISVPERNWRKLSSPMFRLWMIVTILLRNPFGSIHPVLKHTLQGFFGRAVIISRIAASDS
jgi:hypothetical protein